MKVALDRRWIVLALALAGALGAVRAQGPVVLQAGIVPGTSTAPGLMLDLLANEPVNILSFDVEIGLGASSGGTLDIFRLNLDESYLGHESSASDWTLIASAAVPPGFSGRLTGIVIPVPFSLPVQSRAGVYFRASGGPELALQGGTILNVPYAEDTCVRLVEGTATTGSFLPGSQPRRFIGAVTYAAPGGCPSFPYQVNQPEASLSIDGVQSNGVRGAITESCTAGMSLLTIESNAAGNWDLALVAGPVIPNALVLGPPFDQVVNIDLGSPSLVYFNSGASTPALPAIPVGGLALNIPISPPVPLLISGQMVVISPGGPGGFALKISQAVQYNVSIGGVVYGPFADDDIFTITLVNAPSCISGIPFYGGTYNSLNVSTNGRVIPSNGPVSPSLASFSPSLGALSTDPPFIGFWTDLRPNYQNQSQAKISTVFTNTGQLTVTYANIPFYQHFTSTCGSTPLMTFSINFDNVAGHLTISGLNTIPAYPCTTYPGPKGGAGIVAPSQMLGMSPGLGAWSSTTNAPFAIGANLETILPGQARVRLLQNDNTNTIVPSGLSTLTLTRSPPSTAQTFVSYTLSGS